MRAVCSSNLEQLTLICFTGFGVKKEKKTLWHCGILCLVGAVCEHPREDIFTFVC